VENIRDQRAYDPPTPAALEREFPGWHAWKGVNGLWHARRPGTSPPLTAERAEDLQDLRNKIIAAIWRRDNGPIM